MRLIAIIMFLLLGFGCQTAKQPTHRAQELQSVLSEVKKSFNMQDAKVKYCPICGKHYSGHLEVCPVDNATLVPIE